MAPAGARLFRVFGIIAVTVLCPSVQAQQRPAKDVIEAVLKRYHGPLRGGFAKVLLQLREDPEGPPTRVFAVLPDRLRIDPPMPKDDPQARRTVDLLVKGVGRRCRKGAAPTVLSGADLDELVRLRDHVRGLLLLPLYEADTVTRLRPGVFELEVGKEKWQLEVDEKNPELRLIELRGPAGAIHFDSFLDAGVARHPQVVDLAGIGRRHVEILGTGMVFLDEFFEDPLNPKKTPPADMRQRVDNDRPPQPVVREIPARDLLVMVDPGSWSRRVAALRAAGRRMQAAGLSPAGLPFYFREKGSMWLAIPFAKGKSGEAFEPAPGERLVHAPEHRAAVIGPPKMAWEPAVTRGRAAIIAFIASKDLKSAGPLRIMPFVKPTTVPGAKEQKALRLRLELPVIDRK